MSQKKKQNFLKTAVRLISPFALYGLSVLCGLILFSALELSEIAAGHAEDGLIRANEDSAMMLCISVFVLLLLSVLYRRDLRLRRPDFGYRPELPYKRYVLGAALGCAVAFNILLAVSPIYEWFPRVLEVNKNLAGSDVRLALLYAVIAAPLAEELFFRGLLFRRFRDYMGFLPAAVFSALIFGVFHGNMVQFVYAAALGILFSYIYERYGTLKAPMLSHIAANLIVMLGVPSHFCEGVALPLSLLAAAAFLLIAAWGLLRIKEKVYPPRYTEF